MLGVPDSLNGLTTNISNFWSEKAMFCQSMFAEGLKYSESIYKQIKNTPLVIEVRIQCFKFLGLINKDFKSDYYKFRANRIAIKKITLESQPSNPSIELAIISNNLTYCGPALNSPKKYSFSKFSLARTQKDQMLNLARIKLIQNHPNAKFLTNNDRPKLINRGGICCGMILDTAKQIIIDGKPITIVVSSLSKGGRRNAEILQTVYNELKVKTGGSNLLKIECKLISDCTSAKINPFPKLPEGVSSETILMISSQIRDQIIEGKTELAKSMVKQRDWTSYIGKGLFPFEEKDAKWKFSIIPILIYNVCHKILDKNDFQQIREMLFAEVNSIFEQRWNQANAEELRMLMVNSRNQVFVEIRMAVFTLEYQHKKGNSSDSLMMQLMLAALDYKTSFERLAATSALCDMKLISTIPALGASQFFGDDQTYLDNIDKLELGFYIILLAHGEDSAHSFGMFREKLGEGYLVDPAHETLMYKDEESAKSGLKRLLNRYPSKNNIQDKPFHALEIYKLEAV